MEPTPIFTALTSAGREPGEAGRVTAPRTHRSGRSVTDLLRASRDDDPDAAPDGGRVGHVPDLLTFP